MLRINPNIFCTCRNRAVHGDIVVVELLHKSQWKGRSNSLKSKDEDKIMNCLHQFCCHVLYTDVASICVDLQFRTKERLNSITTVIKFHESFFSH